MGTEQQRINVTRYIVTDEIEVDEEESSIVLKSTPGAAIEEEIDETLILDTESGELKSLENKDAIS